MAWLLDTNAWIQILKRRGGSLEQAVVSHPPHEILLCSVVKAELWHGAQKYERRDRRLAVLAKLFAAFVSLPIDRARAEQQTPESIADLQRRAVLYKKNQPYRDQQLLGQSGPPRPVVACPERPK